jgi:hypothetical protein
MKQVIGTRLVEAISMTRAEYNVLRGWQLPDDEDGTDKGYLLNDTAPGLKPNVKGYSGFVSWVPKETFDIGFRDIDAIYFGDAIEAVKLGYRARRLGWNSKDMWIAYSPGARAVNADSFWSLANKAYAESIGGVANVLPCITMRTATGEILMGWLASQSDMLATDWMVICKS